MTSPRATAPAGRRLAKGATWFALDASAADADRVLADLELDAAVRGMLEARPPSIRAKPLASGLFLGLARFAISRDASDDRIVGSALWIEPERVVTVDSGAAPDLLAAQRDPGAELPAGGPWSVAAAHLAELAEDLEDDLHALAPVLDALEDRIADQDEELPVAELSALRQRLIRVRRHAVPLTLLARALTSDRRLAAEPEAQAVIEDAAASVERSQAALGLHFDRSEVLNDQIQAHLAQRMNRATYRLGVVATVFLPLGFLTGLLGINVAGIPGDHNPYAFWLVCGFLILVAVAWTGLIARGGRL